MIASAFSIKQFNVPGPTIAAFLKSSARINGVMGPQGGGKTTGIIQKIFMKASMQPPSPKDGIARYRCIVWMASYREIWAKVIPDWLEWIPQNNKKFGIVWTGGRDNPAEHKFRFEVLNPKTNEKHVVQAEVWFRAVGDQTPQEAAKGLHATDGWLPEATSATPEMRKALFGRLGRYPSAEHGGAPNRELMCDWNAGDPYNWTTEYFIYDRNEDIGDDGRRIVSFFKQPGGRAPDAENLHNLPENYYEDQIIANADDPDWIKRMVDNEIGFMKDGKPVYDNFVFEDHVHPNGLKPWPNIPLRIAADAGLTPAAVIGQRNSLGQWQILEEITTEKTGPDDFAELVEARLSDPRYKDCPRIYEAHVDPTAADAKESSSRSQDNEKGELKSWLSIMTDKTKIIWKPSKCGNDLVIRIASVKEMFKRRVDNRVACAIDGKRCPILVQGCSRDYKFERVGTLTKNGVQYRDKPTKNMFSHVCNALEYLGANGGEQELVLGKKSRAEKNEARKMQRLKQGRGRPHDPLSRYRRTA